jgi:heme A synthase
MSASDEELLLQAARKQRRARRSGRTLIITLAAAAASAIIGWAVLFQLRPLIKSIPLLPLGSVTTALLWIGIAAFAAAVVLVAGGWVFARPGKPWGKEMPGVCPTCENLTLRESAVEVEKRDGANLNVGPKGIVILCDTRRCDYASVKVTTPTRA